MKTKNPKRSAQAQSTEQSSRSPAGFFLSSRASLVGWLAPVLLLVFWAVRLPALEALPLHNDEGLHLTRAVEVWNLHPFWQISDGKIVNHWPIAAFYPQNAPAFTGRIPTLFVSMTGLAAGYSLCRRLFGRSAALLASILWITSPYLFFYERLALSDSEAGALVVVAVWAAVGLRDHPSISQALFTGLALAAAMLFKFTAVPFAFAVLLIVLAMGRASLALCARNLVIIGIVVALCFSVPLGYLALRGDDFFGIALGWIGDGSGGGNIAGNLARLSGQLTDYGTWVWAAATIAGVILLPVWFPRRGGLLVLAWGVPLASMIVLGSEVLPRHYVVALPLTFVLGGGGVGGLIRRLPGKHTETWAVAFLGLILIVGFFPFALHAYRDPGTLPLPESVRTQYVTDHSSGYGLREAMLALPTTVDTPRLPVIASMFPDSCRRANFYSVAGYQLTCTQVPGRDEIEAALAEHSAVYVLTDEAPSIGIDVDTVEASVERVARYPRPGEDEATASVVLWLLRRD